MTAIERSSRYTNKCPNSFVGGNVGALNREKTKRRGKIQ